MAIQILPREGGLGELLGTGLGSGISSGLKSIADMKLQQMQQRAQQQQTMQGLLNAGIPQNEAAAVAMLPQNLQAEYIKNMRTRTRSNMLDQALESVRGQQPVSTQGQSGLQKLSEMRQGAPDQRGIGALFGGGEITPQEKLAVAKFEQKERLEGNKAQVKEQERIDKITQKKYDQVQARAEEAYSKTPLLNEFIRLSTEGDPGAAWQNVGISTLGSMMFGKDADEYTDFIRADDAVKQRKLSAELLKRTIEKMTGRKSRELIRAIKKTFPNVYQNPNAQRYIASTLLYEEELAKVKQKISDEIIKQNNFNRPKNYDQLLSAITRKAEEKLAQVYLPDLGRFEKEFRSGAK